jgi:transcriptional regulator with XRE-family HTH domain
MDIHKRLRKFRKDLDLSYQAIAEACGVKWQTVQQWCKDEADGGTDPKLANLEPLAKILKTTPWYLLFGVEIGVDNSPNRGQNPILSDEADELIQCVMRLDAPDSQVRKTFAYTLGILEIVERLGSVQDADVVSEPAEQQAMRLLEETHGRPTRVPKHHATPKHK